MIISVGYRVKSRRGVEFRKWATRILKERLVADYKRRAEAAEKHLAAFRNMELLAHQADADARDVIELIGRYARSWRLLLQYDETWHSLRSVDRVGARLAIGSLQVYDNVGCGEVRSGEWAFRRSVTT
jgi:hypothetical protein